MGNRVRSCNQCKHIRKIKHYTNFRVTGYGRTCAIAEEWCAMDAEHCKDFTPSLGPAFLITCGACFGVLAYLINRLVMYVVEFL